MKTMKRVITVKPKRLPVRRVWPVEDVSGKRSKSERKTLTGTLGRNGPKGGQKMPTTGSAATKAHRGSAP